MIIINDPVVEGVNDIGAGRRYEYQYFYGDKITTEKEFSSESSASQVASLIKCVYSLN
jgi:hypothetical protein